MSDSLRIEVSEIKVGHHANLKVSEQKNSIEKSF